MTRTQKTRDGSPEASDYDGREYAERDKYDGRKAHPGPVFLLAKDVDDRPAKLDTDPRRCERDRSASRHLRGRRRAIAIDAVQRNGGFVSVRQMSQRPQRSARGDSPA